MKNIIRKKVSRQILIPITLIMTAVVLIGGLFCVNRFRVWVHAYRIFIYPIPPNSQLINTSAQLVNYGGNGCASEVRLFLHSSLSFGEIETYYKNSPVIKGLLDVRSIPSKNDQERLIEVVDFYPLDGC